MRITIADVKTTLGITQSFDIVNAIRNSSTDQFKQYVPLASLDNVAQVGTGLLVNQTVQNEFVQALVDRIGLVVVRSMSLQNPLKKFKKGAMPMGRTIEEIFVDITSAKKYDPSDAETTLYKRQIPNVKTLFHERNRQDIYTQTIQDESLKSAFVSWGNFESFVSGIINSIYNSAEVDEYEYMKLLIDNYYSKDLFAIVPVTHPTDTTSATAFVKQLRATAQKMTLPSGSRDYNSLAVRTRTDMSDLHLIISADLNAEIDVDVLAKAFNMDKTAFLGNVTVIDNFGTAGTAAGSTGIGSIEAVLVDKEWFMVFDNLLKLETVRNPKGLYWNYFYHVWQTMSVSRFSNAVAFVSGKVPLVTQVIIDPVITNAKAGTTFQFNGVVRQTDSVARTLTWTVTAATGSTVAAGTAIDSNGLLTIGATQTGQLSVKATTTYTDLGTDNAVGGTGGAADTTITVTGESIVTIMV
jgi:hypothetical protein